MKAFNCEHHSKLAEAKTNSDSLAAWQSDKTIDEQWDDFLAASPYGHFYQTSIWAEVRKLDGWQPLITIITRNNEIVGGFQMLWRRKSFLGKIGLLLKGPVIASDTPELLKFVIVTLKKVAQLNGLRVLIGQTPDKDDKFLDLHDTYGFSRNYVDFIIKYNTVSIALRMSEEEIFQAIKRTKRQNINTALRKGIKVKQGNRKDLDTFFEFMNATCKRQQVAPNPSSVDFLYKLWDVFSPYQAIKLFMAEYEGEILTCLIVIPFGNTAYLWKFGWSGKHPKLHPNILTYWEIYKWAKANGYNFADLGDIGANLAEVLWRGETPTQAMARTYSYFKTSFGGEIVRLSKGFVHIPNPIVRLGYSLLTPVINKYPFLKKKLIFGE